MLMLCPDLRVRLQSEIKEAMKVGEICLRCPYTISLILLRNEKHKFQLRYG
jgi:hypothetical protein